MTKQQLRQDLLQKRSAMTLEIVKNHSQKIFDKLTDYIEQGDFKNLHIYESIASNNEVDTREAITWLENHHPEINIAIAQTKKPYGLPKDQNYDLVIVPVVGFDLSGNRIGYGGGYYDKFLASNQCLVKIGLSYDICEVESIPTEDHDQKLDMIITEDHVISF